LHHYRNAVTMIITRKMLTMLAVGIVVTIVTVVKRVIRVKYGNEFRV
jgi:uncharacterized membrane protein